MELFQAIFALVAFAALRAYANNRFLGFPTTIGLLAIALVLSVAVLAAGRAGLIDTAALRSTLETVDFSNLLLHGMLAYLLFAGALHVYFQQLRSEALSVALLATVGLAATSGVARNALLARGAGAGFRYAVSARVALRCADRTHRSDCRTQRPRVGRQAWPFVTQPRLADRSEFRLNGTESLTRCQNGTSENDYGLADKRR